MKSFDFDENIFANPNKVAGGLKRDYYFSDVEYKKAIANARASVAKKNMSTFYVWLYHYLQGGRVNGRFRRRYIPSSNGKVLTYHPDVQHRHRDGRKYDVEVKSFSTSWSGGSLCSVTQFENYIASLLSWSEDAGQSGRLGKIGFNYAFFRYSIPTRTIKRRNGKTRKKVDGVSFGSFEPEEFIPYIAEHTNDLIILPENLMVLLLLNCKRYEFNQASSQSSIDSREYWNLRSGDLSKLHKPSLNRLSQINLVLHGNGYKPEGIESILQNYNARHGFISKGYDCIRDLPLSIFGYDKLGVEQYETPRFSVNGNKFNPILVTQYAFAHQKDRAEWIRSLRVNREGLLVNVLGLRDLDRERQEEIIRKREVAPF